MNRNLEQVPANLTKSVSDNNPVNVDHSVVGELCAFLPLFDPVCLCVVMSKLWAEHSDVKSVVYDCGVKCSSDSKAKCNSNNTPLKKVYNLF